MTTPHKKLLQSHWLHRFDAPHTIVLCNCSSVWRGMLKLNMATPIKRFALFSVMRASEVRFADQENVVLP